MSLSPQFTNDFAQPTAFPVGGRSPNLSWLLNQPTEQPIPHSHTAPTTFVNAPTQLLETTWEMPGVSLSLSGEFGTAPVQFFETSYQEPAVRLGLAEECMTDGSRAIAAVREPILNAQYAAPPGDLDEVRYIFQSVSNLVPRQELALKELKQFYVFEDRSQVAPFIERNRLRELLLRAREPLNAAFGTGTLKKLMLATDDEGCTALFCLVRVSGAMQEARRALKLFDQRWWLVHSVLAAGKLNFDFELV